MIFWLEMNDESMNADTSQQSQTLPSPTSRVLVEGVFQARSANPDVNVIFDCDSPEVEREWDSTDPQTLVSRKVIAHGHVYRLMKCNVLR